MNWINCLENEKLPQTKKLVLVVIKQDVKPSEFTFYRRIGFYTKGNEISIGSEDCEIPDCKFCDNDGHFLDEGWYQEIDEHGTCDGCYDILLNVTHWMPLPELPKD